MSSSCRFRSLSHRIAVAVSASVVALAVSTGRPAFAEPGQSDGAFTTWAHQKIALRGVEKKMDEVSGRPTYQLTNADHGIAWAFDATMIGATIGTESLTVGSNGTATGDAIRHDGSGYGFTFWKSLYGAPVAADFLASRTVFTSIDAVNHATTTYYRGARFGYAAAGGGLTIETPAAFATTLAQAKSCAAHPDRCPGD